MKVDALPGTHLTYCTNIHPGETWPEVARTLETLVTAVKGKVSPKAAFGVGLRLAAAAAFELEEAAVLEQARGLLDALGLYVFTLNGFPYGAFHGTRVKEHVYEPDWQEDERVRYTNALARVLAGLLPSGTLGSISTVPGCFGPRAASPSTRRLMARNIARSVAELVTLERTTGKHLILALEPEPACLLETSADAVTFFQEELWSQEVRELTAELTGLDAVNAELALRLHLGVCLDTCHASVEFETPREALARLTAAGIGVPKIQLSAGLRLASADKAALEALSAFDDQVYLHQTVVRPGPERDLLRFVDLAEALEAGPLLGESAEWRVHFHVPVFESQLGVFSSTQADLADLLRSAPVLAPHLEVETYTFDVLPEKYRSSSVTDAIARELGWALGVLGERA